MIYTTKSFNYVGRIYKNCDPSAAQQAAMKAEADFANTMKDAYGQVFGLGTKIFNTLKAGWDKIISTSHGMPPEELAARRAQNLASSAAIQAKANRVIGENAVMGSVVPGVESGVVQAEKAQATTNALINEANKDADITAEDYDIGRKERDIAMEGESNLTAKAFSPAAEFAGATTKAQALESEQANANEAASTSWMGLVGGLADSAVSGLTGGFGQSLGKKKT